MYTNNTIVTQWGSLATSFRSAPDDIKISLLEEVRMLITDIKTNLNITCFVSYGALLGGLREGRLIDHDFDVDLVYLTECSGDEVLKNSQLLTEFLINKNYVVEAESNGQFSVKNTLTGFSIEFFAGWFDKNDFFQYFAIQGQCSRDDVLPLRSILINGIELPGPANPEKIIRTIYGETWRTPNQSFKYNLTESDWKPFRYLFTKVNVDFWDDYYNKRHEFPVWLESPSAFAEEVAQKISFSNVLELGCGNGRDGLFLAKYAKYVLLTDYSKNAIDYCKSIAHEGCLINTEQLDVSDNSKITFFSQNHNDFDLVYCRFFLHAIDFKSESNVIKLVNNILPMKGYFAVEFRAIDLDNPSFQPHYENGEHFRRLVNHNEFKAAVQSYGFEVEFEEVGYGLSVYKNEDPYIARFIFKREKLLTSGSYA